MKYTLLFFFAFATVFSMAQGQTKSPLENVVITSKKNKTEVRTNKNGELLINVSKKDVLKFKASGVVRYSDFGARGDGKTDDIDAIAAAHHCSFSRFDAHQGVANATIRNSTLGHMGINAIGSGIFTVENSTIRGRNFINLRSDYGSTWQGEFVIRNCVFIPAGGKAVSASLINGSYTGLHNFGYTCYMPEKITIENLKIHDSNYPENYKGPAIFANFNPQMTDDSYQENFPYVKTREVILRNVTTTSGRALRLSDNAFMFKDMKVNTDQRVLHAKP